MSKVFISYSADATDFVRLARSQLEQRKIEVWFAEDDIHAGDSWRESIDKAISSSDAMIVVLSPRSSTSSYVTYEWAYALGKGVKVIPVKLKRTAVHEKLETLQYLDFTDPKARQWEKLFYAIYHRDPGALDIFLRDFPSSYMSDLHEARELWLVGVSLRNTVGKLQSALERKLKRGHSLRVLLAEPLASVVEPAVRRTFVRRTFKEQDLGDAIETKCREIRGSLGTLRALQLDHSTDDQLQIRTTKYPLGYGVHGMNLAKPDGVLYVKLYPYRAEELEKPKFILRRDRDQWYDSFERELFALWQDGKQPLSDDTQSTQ